MLYLYIALALIALGFILYYQWKLGKQTGLNKESEKRHKLEMVRVSNFFGAKLLDETLYRVLAQMDKTATFFNDEDEANRELTSCLCLLGHEAKYHYVLDNKRTADILVNNCIVEGKLDPESHEVDRLIGQVADYLSLPYYRIFVVLYGVVSKDLVNRLTKQIVEPNNNRVKLVYLKDARRTRKVNGRVFNAERL